MNPLTKSNWIGGALIRSVQATENVAVVSGVFTVELDFGVLAFNGDDRRLEIVVASPSGSGGFMFPDGTVQTTAAAGRGADGLSLDAVDGSLTDVVFVDSADDVIVGRRGSAVIAQEFAGVFSDHVVSGSGEFLEDGSEVLQVDTYPLTIYSAAAVQELHTELQTKESQIEVLEARISRLEALVHNFSNN